jgi:hypothetical protein
MPLAEAAGAIYLLSLHFKQHVPTHCVCPTGVFTRLALPWKEVNLDTPFLQFCLYSPGLVAIGNAHPDVVDESATLASIKQPECKYKLDLPPEVICGRLSNL